MHTLHPRSPEASLLHRELQLRQSLFPSQRTSQRRHPRLLNTPGNVLPRHVCHPSLWASSTALTRVLICSTSISLLGSTIGCHLSMPSTVRMWFTTLICLRIRLLSKERTDQNGTSKLQLTDSFKGQRLSPASCELFSRSEFVLCGRLLLPTLQCRLSSWLRILLLWKQVPLLYELSFPERPPSAC
jgi:hypothetical protein